MRISSTLLNLAPRRALSSLIARRRFIRSLLPSDVFIVAYPKSGTHWVSFLVATLLAQRNPGGAETLTLNNFRQLVPDINRKYFDSSPLAAYHELCSPRIFTVHAPYDPQFKKVVYLIRDPRDVMVSYFHHHRRRDSNFSLSLEEFVLQNRMWPGDWGDHVAGWVTNATVGQDLLIRYEDLQLHPQNMFKLIVNHCGIQVSDSELADSIERCSFDNMQKLEDRFGMSVDKGDTDSRFMRRGRIGSWRDELGPESVAVVENRYAGLMARLGYQLSSGCKVGDKPRAFDSLGVQ